MQYSDRMGDGVEGGAGVEERERKRKKSGFMPRGWTPLRWRQTNRKDMDHLSWEDVSVSDCSGE